MDAQATTGLSSRGYSVLKSSLTPGAIAALKKELTMTPLSTMGPAPGGGGGPASFSVFMESTNKIYVPKYFGLKRFGKPARRTIPEGAVIDIAFTGSLRKEQMQPVDAFLEAAHDPMRMGGILSLPCGAGKTVIALHLLAVLGRKTLIVVHKDFLLNQWKERIAQFLPGASVGIIKAKIVDIVGRDIVIASLQSLSMKEYGEDVFDGVGLLIIDECHRVGTEVFSRALSKTNFKYSLGLSATVTRKDGMTKAFIHFLGDVLYKGKRREDTVDVVQHRFFHRDERYCKEEMIGIGKPNVSRMINNICAFEPRTQLIVGSILDVVARDTGRKVLVLSDRKSQLTIIKHAVESAGVTAGFYWGGMKPAALADSETKQVMCATFAYAAEGMDVPGLDTLFMVSPKSDIEQSCGRILRQKADERERTPLIFDVVDEFSLFERQAGKRRAFYKKHGYVVRKSIADLYVADSEGSDADERMPVFAFRDDEE
jgi:superfamily II DNA or RNA helicase